MGDVGGDGRSGEGHVEGHLRRKMLPKTEAEVSMTRGTGV
jgi:hypothetical protein